MKDNGLQNLWKNNVDNFILEYSKEELNNLLVDKAKKSMKNLYPFEILFVTCGIFGFFLIIAAMGHKDDVLYVVNNIVLILILIFAVISSLWSYRKMNNYEANEPLKKWLGIRIHVIEASHRYRFINCLLLPVVLIMANISTQVYMWDMSFIDTVFSPVFFTSLFISLIVGIPIIYFGDKKRRKINSDIIRELKDIYRQIEE